ncbi:MAG: AbrB/MazE/SpoVT family DNA-binding domain-containing protein [Nanoarchaeota archaeon]|nr:AbrB/MazE/SpoVT family DNA-binding domain-containing protein [Nanoarchaeota archaeon]MBU4086782.1 AbrB/MazE/SpoVT family DNA-binding domain-containing protein [Nanoarchaeota archaeon]
MKRRVIKQGHNTLTITLPTEWTKKLNIQPGDELDIQEKETSLILNGNENLKEKKTEIDLTGFTIPLLWRFFQSAYRSGCDEIKLKFDSGKKEYEDAYHFYTTQFDYSKLGEKMPHKPALAMIQSVVDRFMGMGVIESGKDYCIVKDMGAPSVKEFDNSLRRVFLIMQQMFERVIDAVGNDEIGDSGICKEIHTIDLNTDRFVDYCCRILNKLSAQFSDSKKMLLFSSLFLLELAGDEFKYIGKHLAVAKKSVKDVLPLAQMVKEHFDLYYELFYKFNRETAINFGKNDYEIYNEHFKIKENLKGEARSMAGHFMMISKFVLALSELRIEMEF